MAVESLWPKPIYARVNLQGVECFQGWIRHTRGFLPRCFFVDSTKLWCNIFFIAKCMYSAHINTFCNYMPWMLCSPFFCVVYNNFRLNGLGASVWFCQKSQRFWKFSLKIWFCVYSFEKMGDRFKKSVLTILNCLPLNHRGIGLIVCSLLKKKTFLLQ